jgi:hypothetical protein
MLGTKRASDSKTLTARVNRIAQTPTYTPPRHVDTKFGKRDQREMSWKPGTLIFQSGERMDVVVKNISETGARIEYVRGTYLPERVRLIEPIQDLNRWAYVTWQTWGVAGLRFVDKA